MNVVSQGKVGKFAGSGRQVLAIQAHLDLLFLIAMGLILPGLLLLPIPILRVPLGLVGVLYVPGNALLKAIYPHGRDLDRFDRLALSFGLSVAIVPVLAYLLDLLPWGIRIWPIALSLSITVLVLSFIAGLRLFLDRSGLQYTPAETQSLKAWIASSHRLWGKNRTYAIILACLGIASAIFMLLPDPSRRSSEFFVLGTEGRAEDYPREVAPGQPIDLDLGIQNHEDSETDFRVEVRSNNNTLAQIDTIRIAKNASWRGSLQFALPRAEDDQQIDILLFRNQETTVYRQLRLWINVREMPSSGEALLAVSVRNRLPIRICYSLRSFR